MAPIGGDFLDTDRWRFPNRHLIAKAGFPNPGTQAEGTGFSDGRRPVCSNELGATGTKSAITPRQSTHIPVPTEIPEPICPLDPVDPGSAIPARSARLCSPPTQPAIPPQPLPAPASLTQNPSKTSDAHERAYVIVPTHLERAGHFPGLHQQHQLSVENRASSLSHSGERH